MILGSGWGIAPGEGIREDVVQSQEPILVPAFRKYYVSCQPLLLITMHHQDAIQDKRINACSLKVNISKLAGTHYSYRKSQPQPALSSLSSHLSWTIQKVEIFPQYLLARFILFTWLNGI